MCADDAGEPVGLRVQPLPAWLAEVGAEAAHREMRTAAHLRRRQGRSAEDEWDR